MIVSWQIFWKLYFLFKNHMDDGQGSSRLTFLLTYETIDFLVFPILTQKQTFDPGGSLILYIINYIYTSMHTSAVFVIEPT